VAQLALREPISLPHDTTAGGRPFGPVSPARHCLVFGRRAGCFSGNADGGETSRAAPLRGRLQGGAAFGCRPLQTERSKAPDRRTRRSLVRDCRAAAGPRLRRSSLAARQKPLGVLAAAGWARSRKHESGEKKKGKNEDAL